jgi:putative aldouronate transport system substrate-binding protein
MKRILAILMALVMILALVPGCGGTAAPTTASTTVAAAAATTAATTVAATEAATIEATTTAAAEESLINYGSTFPVTNKPTELEFCIRYATDVAGKWENLWWWDWMKGKTNVTIVPRMVASDVWNEQKTIMLTSGDLPDVFFVDGWTEAEVTKYGTQDKVFIPLTGYINDTEKMPNLNADLAMKRFASGKADSTLPDGNIYGLPTMMSEYYITASGIRAHWVNDLLLKAGIDYKNIKTLDDFYKALVAIRDGDFNGNGKADEIGWSQYWGTDGKNGMAGVVSYILNAYGLITQDGIVAVNYNTKEAGYAPLMPDYKEAVIFLNKLYKEKLLDQGLFAQVEADMAAKYAAELVGFASYWNPGITGSKVQWDRHIASKFDNSVLSSQVPLIAKAGATPMTWSAGKINTNNFIVTKSCKNPDIAMRWADACYDPMVSTYYRLGPEYKSADDTFGIGWGWKADETVPDAWVQALKDKGEEYTGWQFIQMHVASAASVGYFGLDECLGLFKLHPEYLTKSVPQWTYPYETHIQPYEAAGYPNVYYSEADNKIIEQYKAALDEYVIQMTAKFIAGDESLDKWATFQTQLEALNAKAYNDVLKNAYAAYIANK